MLNSITLASSVSAMQTAKSTALSSSSLPSMLALDGVAAAGTAMAVAPLIAAFDEAITRSAAGENLWLALGRRLKSIVLKPGAFFGSTAFVWMWIVYAATYAAANSLKSIETATNIQLGFAATFTVTIVNMSCGIAKDAAYAKFFGKPSAQQKTPPLAFIVWFLRDLVAFTFILTLPPLVTNLHPNMKLGVAKFITPIFAQYLTTPLHLLGFNVVNMPEASFSQQVRAIGNSFLSTVTARQMRIIPPYSIGGVLNSWFLGLSGVMSKETR